MADAMLSISEHIQSPLIESVNNELRQMVNTNRIVEAEMARKSSHSRFLIQRILVDDQISPGKIYCWRAHLQSSRRDAREECGLANQH